MSSSESVVLKTGPWVGLCPRYIVGGRPVCDYCMPDQHWEGTGRTGDSACPDWVVKQMYENFEKYGNFDGQTPFPGETWCPILNNVTAYERRERGLVPQFAPNHS